MTQHGTPCWYELVAGPDGAAAAGAFYGALLGWRLTEAGIDGQPYALAHLGGRRVAGISGAGTGPGWLIHVAVADAAATCGLVAELGGAVRHDPTEIPGTGRFAVLADPQGAAFGILEHAETPDGPGAFDAALPGAAAWNELLTDAPEAATAFYARVLGWGAGDVHDMGPAGAYRIMTQGDAQVAGIMTRPDDGRPEWLAYFGHPDIPGAARHIADLGGRVTLGPEPVPGGMMVLNATDPTGARFGLVGPARD